MPPAALPHRVPQRTGRAALMGVLLLVLAVSCLLPLLMGADPGRRNPRLWGDVTLLEVAGPPMAAFLLLGAVTFLQRAGRRDAVVVAEEGVHHSSLLRERLLPWEDIAWVGVTTLNRQAFVAAGVTPAALERMGPAQRLAARSGSPQVGTPWVMLANQSLTTEPTLDVARLIDAELRRRRLGGPPPAPFTL